MGALLVNISEEDSAPTGVTCSNGSTLLLICATIVIKACSTFVAFLADVSRKVIPSSFAYF